MRQFAITDRGNVIIKVETRKKNFRIIANSELVTFHWLYTRNFKLGDFMFPRFLQGIQNKSTYASSFCKYTN
jgi:hypothetical protein